MDELSLHGKRGSIQRVLGAKGAVETPAEVNGIQRKHGRLEACSRDSPGVVGEHHSDRSASVDDLKRGRRRRIVREQTRDISPWGCGVQVDWRLVHSGTFGEGLRPLARHCRLEIGKKRSQWRSVNEAWYKVL